MPIVQFMPIIIARYSFISTKWSEKTFQFAWKPWFLFASKKSFLFTSKKQTFLFISISAFMKVGIPVVCIFTKMVSAQLQ